MAIRARWALTGAAGCVALLAATWFAAFHIGIVRDADQWIVRRVRESEPPRLWSTESRACSSGCATRPRTCYLGARGGGGRVAARTPAGCRGGRGDPARRERHHRGAQEGARPAAPGRGARRMDPATGGVMAQRALDRGDVAGDALSGARVAGSPSAVCRRVRRRVRDRGRLLAARGRHALPERRVRGFPGRRRPGRW